MSRMRRWAASLVIAALGFYAGASLRPLAFHLPARAAAPPAHYDSVAMAARAYQRCGKLADAQKTPCYEGELVPVVQRFGASRALTVLELLAPQDSDVASEGHAYAHAIGVTAFDAHPEIQTSFPACREIFQSGCYHGVIQAYFMRAASDDSDAVRGVCAPWVVPNVYGWLRFQCTHGLGHGLTMMFDHHLPTALRRCDFLSDSWDRDSCYGGAFMENIMDATQPKDPMFMRHAMTTRVPGPKFKQIDQKDLAYPCSVLAARYQSSCWVNQVSIIEYFAKGNVKTTSDGCERAPAAYVHLCFIGLGTDLNGYTLGNNDSTLAMCGRASERGRPWCYVGVAKNIVEVGAQHEKGLAFCRRVPGQAARQRCYEGVGEEIASISEVSADRERMCAPTEKGFLAACRFGARLLIDRPPDLPPPL
jgi:hypothetical protein